MPGISLDEAIILGHMTEAQQTAVKALALECLDDEYQPTARVRHLRHILRRRRKKLGLDPFTIIAIVRIAIELWKLWKKWRESDDTAVHGLLASIESEQEDDSEVLGR